MYKKKLKVPIVGVGTNGDIYRPKYSHDSDVIGIENVQYIDGEFCTAIFKCDTKGILDSIINEDDVETVE